MNEELNAWVHWPAPYGAGYFLAFVNRKGSCSMRKFDARTGELIGKPEYPGGGRFQQVFRRYLESGKRLSLRVSPNLVEQCDPKLPADVLAELQRQIGM